MKYIVKYFRNFGFVNRVVWLTVKYNVLLVVLSNKQLMRYIQNEKKADGARQSELSEHEIRRIARRVDSVIDRLPLRRSCLIRSLVKKKCFLNLFNALIIFGVKCDKGHLIAHAWLNNTDIKINYCCVGEL